MKCQGCQAPGVVGRTLLAVPDGKFQGKQKYKYLCGTCMNKPKEKPPEDEKDFPF